MKKLLLMISIFAVVCSFSLQAQSKTPNVVLSSFQHSFNNATAVNWSAINDVFRADFMSGNEKMAAFFNQDGEVIASSRSLSVTEIPAALQADLKKHFSQYEISNLYEVNKEDGVCYYATAKNDSSQMLLKSFAFGGWFVEQSEQE